LFFAFISLRVLSECHLRVDFRGTLLIEGFATLHPPSFSFFLDAKSKKTKQKKEKLKPFRGNKSGASPRTPCGNWLFFVPGFKGGTLDLRSRFVVFGEPG